MSQDDQRVQHLDEAIELTTRALAHAVAERYSEVTRLLIWAQLAYYRHLRSLPSEPKVETGEGAPADPFAVHDLGSYSGVLRGRACSRCPYIFTREAERNGQSVPVPPCAPPAASETAKCGGRKELHGFGVAGHDCEDCHGAGSRPSPENSIRIDATQNASGEGFGGLMARQVERMTSAIPENPTLSKTETVGEGDEELDRLVKLICDNAPRLHSGPIRVSIQGYAHRYQFDRINALESELRATYFLEQAAKRKLAESESAARGLTHERDEYKRIATLNSGRVLELEKVRAESEQEIARLRRELQSVLQDESEARDESIRHSRVIIDEQQRRWDAEQQLATLKAEKEAAEALVAAVEKDRARLGQLFGAALQRLQELGESTFDLDRGQSPESGE